MLIREAIAIYEERGDQAGLGDAYRMYGIFFASEAVSRWHRFFQRNGFRDKTVKFDERHTKAIEYLERAEPLLRTAERYDLVCNVHYVLGWTLAQMGLREPACRAFDLSRDAHEENVRRNPTAKQIAGRFTNVPEALTAAKRDVGCE
jgi:hypothetical protein